MACSTRIFLALCAGIVIGLSGCGKPNVKTEATRLEHAFSAAGTNAYVAVALSAIRNDDYVGGVVALQSARRVPGMSADQLIAVQEAMQVMTEDLVRRADAGDPKARADLALIERSRS